ncbi:hypothetical protein ACFL1H_00765 [Nanoarchaeota archaeon]
MKRRYKYFIDLEIILNLCKILNIDLKIMQKNIIAYKTRRGWNYVENPKLPVIISPIYDMLVAHHIGDGCLTKIKGRQPYFGYTQFNKEIRLLYINKLESLFGKINYKRDYHSNAKQVYCPAVFTNIFLSIYLLKNEDYLENQSKVPKPLFRKNWKYKLAFLLGIILDEGHVDSTLIVIGLKNEILINGLQKICRDLNYFTTLNKLKDNRYYLYINSKSLVKLYNDYKKLLSEYPEVNLSYKEQRIEEFINRINKPKIYIKGNKSKILEALIKKDLTVNQLAIKFNMTRQGARYLIKELMNENKIKIKSIVKYGSYKYGLR